MLKDGKKKWNRRKGKEMKISEPKGTFTIITNSLFLVYISLSLALHSCVLVCADKNKVQSTNRKNFNATRRQ